MFREGWLPQCAICKSDVNLEQCKVDEYGQAVHEDCYIRKIGGYAPIAGPYLVQPHTYPVTRVAC
jgi:hypothetical protein